MASIDKAAIVFSIAITAVGAGFAFVGDSVDFPIATTTAPPVIERESTETEERTSSDPFADLAEKVKSDASMREETMMEEEMMMEETMEEMMEVMEETMMEEEMMMEETMEEMMEEMMEEVMEETMMEEEMMMEETMEETAGPMTHVVEMPAGTSVPGCEETNECYLPADITINAGDTVEWVNLDTAAHTVTSGSPADGPSGVFDSSLVMGSASYSFTFEEAGSYDYFCIVHPWMTGTVTVN